MAKTLMVGIAAALLTAGLAAALPVAEEHVVQINGKTFQPDRIEIKVGEKVTWKNYDLEDHTVTSQPKPAQADEQQKPVFDSGPLKPGQSFDYTFTKAGSYPYYCQMHKGMTGVVVVTSGK